MSNSDELIKTLEERGYHHHFSKDIYISNKEKTIISREVIEDFSKEEIGKRLDEINNYGWKFIFSVEPDKSIKYGILKDLGYEN